MHSKIRNVCGLATLMTAVFASTAADAQVAFSPFVFGPGNYGGGTAEGNYLSGLSQVIRAEGEYNLASAQASSYFEEARAKYIENNSKWAEAYFEAREANMRLTAEKFARSRHSPKTLARAAASGVPRTLNPAEFDPGTGKIEWPSALRGSDYGPVRTELARLFESRARTGQAQTVEVHERTRKMASLLRRHVKDIPANDYIAARKFLDGLDYSAMKPGELPPRPGSDLGREKLHSGAVRVPRTSSRPASQPGTG